MLSTSIPVRSSENSTVIEDNEVGRGKLRMSTPARSPENSTVVGNDEVGMVADT